MKQNYFLLIGLCILYFMGCSSDKRSAETAVSNIDSTFTNPVYDGADPWVIKHNEFYYTCYSSNNGIVVSKSKLMTKRGNERQVWKAPDTGWNSGHVWAPELHFIDGRWYIYYAAGKDGPPFIHQKSGVLRSVTNNAQGKYEDMGMLNTGDDPNDPTANVWTIDVNVFEHKGQLYGVWSGWKAPAETDKTSQHLYIAPMSNPYTISKKRVKISSPEEPWETGGPLDLNEGPEVLKHDEDVFIIYSCRESWLKEYRLGQLRLKSPESDPLDPSSWIKSGPVFQGSPEVLGAGHASFTQSPDGTEDWIIYHSKKSEEPGWDRDIRMQPFTWKADGSPDFGKPVPAGEPIPRPSGELDVEIAMKDDL